MLGGATLGVLIGARGGPRTAVDSFVLRVLLAGCLGALAVVVAPVGSGAPSITLGVLAVALVATAAAEHTRPRRARRRARRQR